MFQQDIIFLHLSPEISYNHCMKKNSNELLSSFDIIQQLCGDKWKFLIICSLFNGPRRFGELLYQVDSITKKVLTENLRSLEDIGILTRTLYPGKVKRVEYSLTETGLSLKPIFHTLIEWSVSYFGHSSEKTDASGDSASF